MPRPTLPWIWTLLCLACLPPWGARAEPPSGYNPAVLPQGHDYYQLRDGLPNCRLKFQRDRQGRVAFLGGSITASSGWRELVMDNLRRRFPETRFDFISAGVPSLGSVPHAFRLERDILARGPVDLLFVEAAVNDSTNTSDSAHMLRGMEGVVRHVRLANRQTEIVHLHFVMPEHMTDFAQGKTPISITQHERVAEAYGNASLNLSREVTDRIAAGQFTWERDFRNLHPAPFGHRLYADSIDRLLTAAWSLPAATAAQDHRLPEPLDAQSYFRGRLGSIAEARPLPGFTLEQAWRPSDQKGTRAGFVGVPALVGTAAGAEFEFTFDGTAAGLFLAAGPDAGRIEFSVDGGPLRKVETFTRWSSGLHLPWALILDDQLPAGRHTVRVRIAADHADQSTGTAVRVFHLLVN